MEMRELSVERNGECISNIYVNAESKLLWKCDNGHVFEATPHSVKRGRWCKICGWEEQKFKLEDFQILAEMRGGKCLSEEYISSTTKLTWECKYGHLFEATPYTVKKGSWCGQCSRTKASNKKISEFQLLAEQKSGNCLSEKYINSSSKLTWRCTNGHIWETLPDVIKRGHWCPICAQNKTLTIEEMKNLAKARGGKCLSDHYINSDTKLKWECSFGHVWEATPGNVKRRKSWCPYCSNKFSSEEICRYVFETLFDLKFPKLRPSWLVNDQGNRMELDGYCKELKLAFEHQGDQHFRKIEFFERTMTLKQKKMNDELKRSICIEKGINIIYINQLNDKIKLEDLKDYILDQCVGLGLNKLAQKAKKIEINYSKSYSSYSSKMLLKLNKIANTKGGQLLSDRYINNNYPLKWRCSKGHVWETAPVNIKNMGHWCPTCSGNQKLTMQTIQQVATERGGQCLSKEYVNKDTKLLWECSNDHTWEATLRNVKGNGTWCPTCAGKIQYTIKDMRTIARDRGGECLSKNYITSKTKLLWRCSKGHVWETAPENIKNMGHWCPTCAGNQKLTIKEMRQLAIDRGGECLSESYINSKTKLLWKCAFGHTWSATPNNIKQGKWCPLCYSIDRSKSKKIRNNK